MRKKGVLAVMALCLALSLGFFLFSGILRDGLSPKAEVMAPALYGFSDGGIAFAVLKNESFFEDEDGVYVLAAEESSKNGETAYFARRIPVVKGRSDEEYTEMAKTPLYQELFVCGADRKISDGDRIVIVKIVR